MSELLGKRTSARDLWPRLAIFGSLAAIAFVVLLGRLYHLQVSMGRDYFERSVNNFVKDVKIPADRGLLLDRRGELLADSRPSFDIYLTPYFCGKACDEVIGRMSAYLGLTAEEQAHVREKLAQAKGLVRFKPFLVKVDLDREAVDVFEAHRSELDGIDLIPAPHRNYRQGTLGAHLLGYLSEVGPDELDALQAKGLDYHEGDYIGRRGVERAFERWLRGRDGAERVVVDAKGRRLVGRESLIPESDRVKPSHPGNNVVLSIDERLQKVADESFPGKAGAVVALDPNTGFILAIVSRPEFDPNRLTGRVTRAELLAMAQDPLKPDLFRPVQEQYHPGSTFKVVTALAGLGHHAITPESDTSCNGGYSLGRRRWRCWKDGGHGLVDLHRAIVQSCDTFFYWVADRMGIDALAETARGLGLGRPTGLGLGAEVAGIIPDVAYHDRVTPGGYQRGFALNAGIGQGDVNVTPLQMALLYAAIANGGTVYRPQVVRRIEDPDGKTLKVFEPEVTGRLSVRPEDLAAVVKGLTGVVNEPGGTAYRSRLKDVVVAGKTGTAAVVAYGENLHAKLDYWHNDHGWFCAFAPADKPEIAVAVINEHAGHGGSASAPTAMAVIQAYFDEKKEDEAAHASPAPTVPPEPGPHGVAPPGSPKAGASPAPRGALGILRREASPWS
ncbi:MAG: penicillin-binding protein 2 [Deltaproteobacteria bacterium]